MVVCEVCGWEGKHQGALNLHKVHCRYKQMNVSRETKNIVWKNDCECEYRFLNSQDRAEKKAIDSGYSEVCIKCQSLRV